MAHDDLRLMRFLLERLDEEEDCPGPAQTSNESSRRRLMAAKPIRSQYERADLDQLFGSLQSRAFSGWL